jgi:N utilization substance protein B
MNKGIRRRGREFSLKIIYSLHDHEENLDNVLDDFWRNFRFREDVLGDPFDSSDEPLPYEVRRFTEELTAGVYCNIDRIDDVIRDFSTNWALDRMARVDLALLRLATYELLFNPETPTSVVINESIEIGKRYGTKDTPAFLNGILDKISRTYRPGSP